MSQVPNQNQPLLQMSGAKKTPSSVASAIGYYSLVLVQILGLLIVTATACTIALLVLKACVFFYHFGVDALGLEVGNG